MEIEVVLAFVKKYLDEKVSSLEVPMGPRGPKGLRGMDGADGPPGKDFIFAEHEESLRLLAKEVSLKFSELAPEELEQLKGEKGRDGKDGKSFLFDDHKGEISSLIENEIISRRSELKLSFSDLSEEEVSLLRGPRGQRGSQGKGFVFEEHKEYFDSLKMKFSDLTDEERESLKLRFSSLTDEERESLKLKFSDLSEEDMSSLRGPRGQRGKTGATGERGLQGLEGPRGPRGEIGPQGLSIQGPQGKSGLNGVDGKDAPQIVDIVADQTSKTEFKLEFLFDDNTKITTGPVEMPVAKSETVYVTGGGIVSSGGSGGTGTPGSQYYFGAGVPDNSLYLDGDIYQNTTNGDQYKKISGVWVLQDNIMGPPGADGSGGGSSLQLIENIPCESDVYLGSVVRMKQGVPVDVLMSDWVTLDGLYSLDATTYSSVAANAIANSYDTSNAIGICESKLSATICTIRIAGVSAALYFGLDVVEEYYLSDITPGGVVPLTSSPTAAGHVLLRIGQPTDPTKMLWQRGERLLRA